MSRARYGDVSGTTRPSCVVSVKPLLHVTDHIGDDLCRALVVEDPDLAVGADRYEHQVGLDHTDGEVDVGGGRVHAWSGGVGKQRQVGRPGSRFGGDADHVQQDAGDLRCVRHDVGDGRVDAVSPTDLQLDGLLLADAPAAPPGRPMPSRVSRMREGAVGIRRAPSAAVYVLVENQPKTSTTTLADAALSVQPDRQGAVGARPDDRDVGDRLVGCEVDDRRALAGRAPLPYASR